MPLTITVLALGLTGLLLFLIALAIHGRSYAAASGLEKAIALACPLEAAALGAFGAGHLFGAALVAPAVPHYVPWPLFWTYVVGLALAAAPIQLRFLRPAATLAGIMLFLFVAMIHIPNLTRHLGNRIFWNVALRDLTFAAGLIALAATASSWPPAARTIPRLIAAVVAIVFGVQHLLYAATFLLLAASKQQSQAKRLTLVSRQAAD